MSSETTGTFDERGRLDKSEKRFWKLYREERKKLAPDKQILSSVQIVRAAREARRRLGG